MNRAIDSTIRYCKTISSSQKDEFERILSIHLNNGWKIEGEFEHAGNSFSQSITIEINYYHHARFYESGELEELGHYDKDTITNDDIELFDNGKIMHKYSDGKLLGKLFKYHVNGDIKEEADYLDEDKVVYYFSYLEGIEMAHGFRHKSNEKLINSWDENGKIMVRDGCGEHVEYDADEGNIDSKINYLNYKKNGELIGYFDNGNIELECNYLEDRFNGIQTHYYEDGQIMKKGSYVNGILQDKLKTYYPKGQIECEFIEKNDKLYLLNNWDINGDLMIEDGNGLRKIYWLPDEELDRGLSIKESEGPYEDGLKHGKWHEYEIDGGMIVSKGNFLNGEEEGVWTYYDSSGNVKNKINYKEGKEIN